MSCHESHEDPVLANGQLDKDCKISKVISVEAGGMMSCAIDQNGLLWMWGDCPIDLSSNSNSSLTSTMNIPRPVLSLQQFRVLKVSCGSQHVLTLVSRGDTSDGATGVSCYAWGSNKYGQLGLGDKQRREQPQHVISLNEPCVGMLTDIACGAYHSAVLTCNTRWDMESSGRLTSDGDSIPAANQSSSKRKGMCWTFGLGENGQLGHGNTRCLDLPEMIHNLPEDENLMHVACGLFHMGVVTESGDVWTWGMEMGLGLCPGIGPPGTGAGDYLSPVKVFGYYGFDSSRGETMTCGAAHTVLVTNEGSALWAWGRGENGVLGTGQVSSSLTPVSVVWPPSLAAAGMENTLSLPKQPHMEPAVDEEDDKQKLISLAQREICTLTTELAAAKHSTAVLQAAVYGSLDPSKQNLTRDVLQDWKKTIETSSYDDLVHLDSFYREVHSHVKEVLLKRKVEKLCRECLGAMKADNTVDVAKSIIQQIE